MSHSIKKNGSKDYLILVFVFFLLQSCILSSTDSDTDLGLKLTKDTEAPRIKILSPEDGDTIGGDLKIIFEVGDLSGLDYLELIVDDQAVESKKRKHEKAGEVESIDWNTRDLNGNVQIRLTGTDPFGNTGESDPVNISIRNLQFLNIYTEENSELRSNNVSKVHIDSQNRVYLNTEQGLHILDEDTWSYLDYYSLGLDGWATLTFYIDETDSIWVGSNNGIFKYRNGRFAKLDYPNGDRFHFNVSHIIKDKDGTIWLGTTTAGIFKFLDPDFIRAGGGIGDFPCYNCDGSNVPSNTSVNDMILNSDGYPVVAFKDGLYQFNGSEWIELNGSTQYHSLALDPNGTIWASKSNPIEYHFFNGPGDDNPEVSEIIGLPILFDDKGNKFFISYNLLLWYQSFGDEPNLIEYNTDNSMLPGTPNFMALGPDNTIWIPTNSGVAVVNYK